MVAFHIFQVAKVSQDYVGRDSKLHQWSKYKMLSSSQVKRQGAWDAHSSSLLPPAATRQANHLHHGTGQTRTSSWLFSDLVHLVVLSCEKQSWSMGQISTLRQG